MTLDMPARRMHSYDAEQSSRHLDVGACLRLQVQDAVVLCALRTLRQGPS